MIIYLARHGQTTLSVSSAGSLPLQSYSLTSINPATTTFSILCRIVASAIGGWGGGWEGDLVAFSLYGPVLGFLQRRFWETEALLSIAYGGIFATHFLRFLLGDLRRCFFGISMDLSIFRAICSRYQGGDLPDYLAMLG